MNIETLVHLISIISSAPEHANYVTDDGSYLLVEGMHCKIFIGVWSVPITNVADVFIDSRPRALDDIRLILKLESQRLSMVKLLHEDEHRTSDWMADVCKRIKLLEEVE